MKFKFPFLKEKKSEYFLTLDIGTEAVKTLIFKKSEENKKVIILGRSLEYFDRPGVFDSRDFEVDLIKKAILKSVEGVHQNFLGNLGRLAQKPPFDIQRKNLPILLGLPANILKERVVFQSFERKNPQVIINKKEESEIYQAILKETQQNLSQNFSQELGILPEDIKPLNFKILEIKIDGYKIPNPRRFSGRKLDFRILTTFSLSDYLKNIEKITKNLNLNIFKILDKSQNLSYFSLAKKNEAIFLDIGGEISQVFLVKKGKLEGISEFSNGGINFTKKLSQILGLSLEEARVLKHNYSNLLLSEEVRKRIREIFSEELQIWFENFKRTLKRLLVNRVGLLPSEIFLFGGGSSLPEIEEILEEGNWIDLPFISQPKVKIVFPKDLKNIEDMTQALISPQDTASLLICLQ